MFTITVPLVTRPFVVFVTNLTPYTVSLARFVIINESFLREKGIVIPFVLKADGSKSETADISKLTNKMGTIC